MGFRSVGVVLFLSTAFAQTYEIGGNFGYGFYRNGTVFSAASSSPAGIRNRFAAGVVLGKDSSELIAAEFRYLYQDGHPFLTVRGVTTDIQGQSHALTVDLAFHLNDREHRLRPFVLGGAGAKDYVIAGPEPFPQRAPEVASLIANDVWKVALVLGGGLKFRLRDHVLLRGELLDYITTFPRQQIVPAPHNTARGVFEQFTPLFGLSYTF